MHILLSENMMIAMYRLWLHGLYGIHGPPMSAVPSLTHSLKFIPKDPIHDRSSLILLMAWCQKGIKPLAEPMMSQFNEAEPTMTQFNEEYMPCRASV